MHTGHQPHAVVSVEIGSAVSHQRHNAMSGVDVSAEMVADVPSILASLGRNAGQNLARYVCQLLVKHHRAWIWEVVPP